MPLLPGDKNRGKDQAAYRIIVREPYNTGVIVWDSNIVSSNASNLVEYNGDMNLLVPDKSYSWTVQYFYQNKENDDDLSRLTGISESPPSSVSNTNDTPSDESESDKTSSVRLCDFLFLLSNDYGRVSDCPNS